MRMIREPDELAEDLDSPTEPEDAELDEDTGLAQWKRFLVPVSTVSAKPPKWIIPNLIVPGLNILAGPPKMYKSTLVLNCIAAVTEREPIRGSKAGMVAAKKGTAIYAAAEQSAGTLRRMYEERVRRKKMKPGVNWDFVLLKDPLRWQLDEHEHDYNWVELLRAVKPTLAIIDPLVSFHNQDENDPRMIRPLIPLREEVLKYGGALIIVHHTRKEQDNGKNGASNPSAEFGKIRGTSALWGMADGGLMLKSLSSGAVSISGTWKDYPSADWTWRHDA